MPVLDSQIWEGQEKRETGIPRQLLRDKDLIKVKHGELRMVVQYTFFQNPMVNWVSNPEKTTSPE